MVNKDWDDLLKQLFGENTPPGDLPDWEDFAETLNNPISPSGALTHTEDEALREKIASYTPTYPVSGWDKIAASLDASDHAFDETVKQRVRQYTAPRHPDPWTEFLRRFTARKRFRTNLLFIKASEVAVVALLLLTYIQLEQTGRLQPSDTKPHTATLPPPAMADAQSVDADHVNAEAIAIAADRNSKIRTENGLHNQAGSSDHSAYLHASNSSVPSKTLKVYVPQLAETDISGIMPAEHEAMAASVVPAPVSFPVINEGIDDNNDPEAYEVMPVTPKVSMLPVHQIASENQATIPVSQLIKTSPKSFVQFGMMAQVDYNQLKMPGDRVSVGGKQAVFPLQGLSSAGYGGGFSLAIGNSILFVETGMVYSSKSFSPGREFTIGDAVDQSSVAFDAMRMQVISVPLQVRYHFERQGRLKAYALAGFGLHFIAQSDIDLDIDYNFASLADGEDPNNVPSLARTIRQTQIVSDGFRKKGSFSSHSLISANLGGGLEYALPDQKMIFAQATYQYQIPDLRYSSRSSKHLLSLSFQAGVRAPLGT